LTSVLALYDEAITSAFANQFYYVAGIAAENALKFLIQKKVRYGAGGYLESACLAYKLWDANAKVEALMTKYSAVARFGFSKSINSSVYTSSAAVIQATNQILSSGKHYLAKIRVICEVSEVLFPVSLWFSCNVT
jgi:hypothetical protein